MTEPVDESNRDPSSVHVALEAVPLRAGSDDPKADAPDEKIREVLRSCYSGFVNGKGPNLNQIVNPVKKILWVFGLDASKERIQGIADEPEFKVKRRPCRHRRT